MYLFRGRVIIPVDSVKRYEENETWFTLLPKTKTDDAKALGEVLLKMTLK